MRFRWMSALAFGVFFSLGAFAGPDIVEPQPNRPVTRIPLIIEMDPAELAKFSPAQLARFNELKAEIAETLTVYSGFAVNLPRPLPGDGALLVSLQKYFNSNTASHLEEMAKDDEGKQKRLTPAQRESFRVDATFANESAKHPGKFDVWKIRSSLLQKGENAITLTFRKDMAAALWHITVKIPEAIAGNTYTSAWRGIQNIYFGLRNSLSLVVGLSETVPTHSAQDIEELLDRARTGEIVAALKDAGESDPSLKPDLRMAYPQLLEKAQPVVWEIWEKAEKAWELKHQDVRAALTAQIREGSVSERALKLADGVEEARQAAFFAAIAESPELEAISPGLGALIVRHGTAQSLIEKAKAELSAEVAEFRAGLEETLRRDNPVLAEMPEWLDARLTEATQNKFEELRGPRYEALIAELVSKGLKQEAISLRAGLHFTEAQEADLRESIGSSRKAGRVFQTYSQIWSAKNWVVTKVYDDKIVGDAELDENGQKRPFHFVGDSYQKLPDVYTSVTTWRLLLAAERAYSIFKGGLYWLAYRNWWNGPVGLRSLYSWEPFVVAYIVDPATGAIVPNTKANKMGTVVSRFIAGQQALSKIRADFKAKPNKSEIPKWVMNIPHAFFYGFLMRVLHPIFVSGGQLAVTGLNFGLPVYAGLYGSDWMASHPYLTTAAALFPLTAALTTTAISSQIYDFDHPRTLNSPNDVGDPAVGQRRNTGRWFPMLAQAGERMGRRGVVPAVLRSLQAVFWDGLLVGGGRFVKGWGHWAGASLRDWAFRSALFALKPKVPAQDPGFFFRRIKGAGVSNGYFHQVDSRYAVAAHVITLQIEELTLHREVVEKLLNAPEAEARAFFAPESTLMNGTGQVNFNEASVLVKAMRETARAALKELDAQIAQRKTALTALLPPTTKEPIKLTQAELDTAVAENALITQSFFESRAFTQMGKAHQDAFWTKQNLTRGDWVGLTQKLMKQTLGAQVLQPMDASEVPFAMQVEKAGLGEVVDSFVTGGNLIPDGEPTPIWSAEYPQGAPASFEALTGSTICARGLAAYGRGMDTLSGIGFEPRNP
jgi:hypothetical protein